MGIFLNGCWIVFFNWFWYSNCVLVIWLMFCCVIIKFLIILEKYIWIMCWLKFFKIVFILFWIVWLVNLFCLFCIWYLIEVCFGLIVCSDNNFFEKFCGIIIWVLNCLFLILDVVIFWVVVFYWLVVFLLINVIKLEFNV